MLKPKHKNFCLNYVSNNGNASQAYIDAGFDVNSRQSAKAAAFRLLRNPEIQEEIKRLMGKVESSRLADVAECQETLTSIMRDLSVKAITRIKAAEVLLRTYGAFETNVNIQTEIPVVISGGSELEE